MVKQLLDAKADVKARGEGGWIARCVIVQNGSDEAAAGGKGSRQCAGRGWMDLAMCLCKTEGVK
jgi:hypothetical protein